MTTKAKQTLRAAQGFQLVPGHEKKGAWARLHEIMFGMDVLGRLRAGGPDTIRSVGNLLEHARRTELPDLPAADMANLVRDERRPSTSRERTHPVHDPRWYTPGQRRLWIPWAADAPSGARRGLYPRKYPAGLIVHWTAGHRNGLQAGNDFMRASGMLYLLMDAAGAVSQSDPLSHWGYHAGKSSHPGAAGAVSDEFAGVELQCWGGLAKVPGAAGGFRGWAGHAVPAEEVISVPRKKGNIAPGHYQRYTAAQVDALRRLCVWLKLNNPDVFEVENIAGHDEVSPGRKVDPGGSLWWDDPARARTMAEFRDLVREDVEIVRSLAAKKTAKI